MRATPRRSRRHPPERGSARRPRPRLRRGGRIRCRARGRLPPALRDRRRSAGGTERPDPRRAPSPLAGRSRAPAPSCGTGRRPHPIPDVGAVTLAGGGARAGGCGIRRAGPADTPGRRAGLVRAGPTLLVRRGRGWRRHLRGPAVGHGPGQADRVDEVREGGARLGVAQQQPAVRLQPAAEAVHHRGDRPGIEVDQHVAAQDQVVALARRTELGEGQEIAALEPDQPAEFGPQGVAALPLRAGGGGQAGEVAQPVLRRHRAQGPAAVLGAARGGERLGADVGPEDGDPPVGQGVPEEFAHQDRQGVGLRPRRAAGAPDPQGALGGPGGDQRRQDRGAQRLELLGVAEEERLADGDLGLEPGPLRLARRAIRQERRIGRAVGPGGRPEPAVKPLDQQLVLVDVVVVAGPRDDPRLQGGVVGVGARIGTRAARARHRALKRAAAARRAARRRPAPGPRPAPSPGRSGVAPAPARGPAGRRGRVRPRRSR